MSTFGGVYFTNKGRALQAKALTGIQLNFTKLVVGDGNLTGQVIQDLTALIHEVKTISITTLKNTNDGKSTIGGVLTNQGLSAGFYWRELGLFATDPDLGEILYCYGNAAALAEYIPAGGGADLLEKQINIVAIIGNATSVSATIDNSLVYATYADLTLKVDKVAGKVLSSNDYTTTEKDKLSGVASNANNYAHPSTHPSTIIRMADNKTLEEYKTANDSALVDVVHQPALNTTNANVTANINNLNTHLTDNLLRLDIKGTTQTPTIVGANITQIVHKDSGNLTLRTDVFTYTATLITEARTLASGQTLTLNYYFNSDGSYNRTEVS